MPLATTPILLALAILLTAVSGLWLLINARAVARLFRRGGIEPGPGIRQASRKAALGWLIAFNVGWIACIVIWSFTASGEANEAVETGEL